MAEINTLVSDVTSTLVNTSEPDCKLFNFIMWGCIVMIFCYFGYLGNLLSFFALQRDARSSATTLLKALALSDVVLLLSVNLTDAIPYVCEYSERCPNPWRTWPHIRYLWLLTPVGHMCSIWLVVLVAANRYWAVCKPHTAAIVWSNGRTYAYVASVVCAAIIFNIPRLFEYEIVDVPFILPGGARTALAPDINHTSIQVVGVDLIFNLTNSHDEYRANDVFQLSYVHLKAQNSTSYLVPETRKQERITNFGQNQFYKVGYKVVIVNILLVIFPLPFLFFSSLWIIRSLKLSAERRKSVNKRVSSTAHDSLQDSCRNDSKKITPSKEVTFLLIAVVLVAVACQSPLAVFHFVRYVFSYKCGDVVFYLESGSKLLVTFNSCVNFIVYCVLSPKFRRLLKSLITCKKVRKKSFIPTSQGNGKSMGQPDQNLSSGHRQTGADTNIIEESATELAALIKDQEQT